MGWAAQSTLVLVVALSGAFAWYERSAPSSRTLALVATLAALAALGRIAFAALPDVKPTTDIVLVCGLVLGGAPGFAVGAVAALTSNLFFGEGAWTPWQMAAWGAVGLYGAALGRLGLRPGARVRLALAGAMAGWGFGVIMNLFTWTQTGPFTLDGFAVIEGQAIGFDTAHAVANVLFALAFGPALGYALTRFRDRLEVTWVPLGTGAAAVALVGGLALAAALPGVARGAGSATTARRAADYLAAARNADGGYGSVPRSASSPLYSAWAAIGLAAAGRRAPGAARYLEAGAIPSSIGDLERELLALDALGSRRTGALGAVLARRGSADGSYSGQVNLSSFAVLALRGAGVARPALARTASWIARQQNPDGGFDFARRGGVSGVDDTAGAVEALCAAGRRGTPVVRRALRWMIAQEAPDGGFPLSPGDPSNAQSAAFAVQALIAGGRDPGRRGHAARSPLGYLASLQAPDGSIRYSRTSSQTPVWVTGQALAALARRSLPVVVTAVGHPAATAAHGRGARARAPSPPRRRARRATPARGARRATPRVGDLSPGAAVVAREAGAIVALMMAPLGA